MKKFGLLGASALGSAAFVGFSLALTAPAMAQGGTPATTTLPPCAPDTAATTDCVLPNGQVRTAAAADAGTGQSITVTGTHIRRPNLESTVPIASIGGQELF